MRHVRFAALLALLAPVVSMPVQAADAVAPADAAARAMRLAKLLNESSDVEEQVDRMLATMASQAFVTDANLRLLKEEYPGVETVFLDTMRPIMQAAVADMMPGYNADVAAFFSRNFTSAELDQLLTFWTSPAGQTVLRQTSRNADFSAITKEVVDQIDDEDMTVSTAAIDADKRQAATAAVKSLSSEHRLAIVRFGLTPTGIKMRRLLPEKNQIDHKWANRDLSPELVARVEREIPEALFAYLEAENSKRAAAK